MQNQWTAEQFNQMRGTPVYSSDGEKIGQVEEIFTDIDTGQPEWLGIGTGFLRMKRVLVPVAGASTRDDGFYVAYTKDQVKDSPDIDDQEIGQDTERELYSYYGLGYSESRSDTGLPEGAPSAGTTGRADVDTTRTQDQGSVTRAEEELRVGTRPVEAGRLRLRKWTETEPVSEQVELRQETARVEREPINQPVSTAELGDEEIEIPLRAEEAVVDKKTVAKERVSVGKDVESRSETVEDELRKERVQVEGEGVEVDETVEGRRT
jgi:uncharacterized protein (TIGR02271 family)